MQFEGIRNTDSCKLFWKNACHPLINTTKWQSQEDTRLVELAVEYKGVCWEDIAKELGVGIFNVLL